MEVSYDGLVVIEAFGRAYERPATAAKIWRRMVLKAVALVALVGVLAGGARAADAARTPAGEPMGPPPVLTPLPATVPGVAAPSTSLCGTWRFSPAPPERFEQATFDDARWAAIEVPGEWVMQGFTVVSDTAAGYRRRFTVPADWAGKRIKIRFDAVYSDAVVWINGRKAGSHLGGFTAWELDVADLVQPGRENVIALAVKSESIADILASGSSYAAHQLGGIVRKVTLFAVPEVNLRSLHAVTTFDGQYRDATLQLLLKIANQGGRDAGGLALRVSLTGPDGTPVAMEPNTFVLPAIKAGETLSHAIEILVAAPAKWDCEHPNLYTLQGELVAGGRPVETVARRIGFRQVEVRGNQLFVNDRPVKLRGVCRHEVHPLRGRSLTPELWRKDVELFRAANVNYIRTSHYPPAEEFVDLCDELGMFVEEESPLCWIGHPTNPTSDAWNLMEPKYLAAIVRPTLEMIERDRSHPSVILWSLANESAWKPHFVVSRRQAEAADPTRPLTFHDQCWGEANNFGSDAPIAVFHYPGTDGPARAADGSRPTLFGEYCHVPSYNREELATDPGVRDYWGKYFAAMWEKMLDSKGVLGGAIWAGLDDVFQLPSGRVVGYGEWGLLDGWRRAKPEYWHVKKAYSPVKILDGAIAVPARGEPLRLRVANRHDFTNLSELRMEWAVGDESGIAVADVPPRSEGTIEIRPKGGPLDGKQLALKISSPRGFVIDEYRLPIGTVEPPVTRRVAGSERSEGPVSGQLGQRFAMPQPPQGGLEMLPADGKTITVRGKGFRWEFDGRSGMIRRGEIAGRTVVLGGPTLMLLPLKGGRTLVMPNHEIPPLNGTCSPWRATGVKAVEHQGGVEIRVAGKYNEAEGNYTVRIGGDGRLAIGYRFTCLRGVKPRQTGIVLDLPRACDTLAWRRNAPWSVYPEDHIGRGTGKARAFGPVKATNTNPRVEPTWPWTMDANALGTNDFRATRENILFAALADSDGYGLRVESDGRQSARAYVEGDRVRLLVAGFNTGGGGWYEDANLPRKPLRAGSVVEDTVHAALFGPAQ